MAKSQDKKRAEKYKRFLKKKMKQGKMETPEQYFFKYAFPCAFLPFKIGEITKEDYNKFEKKFRECGSPSRKELENTFPFAFKMIKRLAKRMKKDYWSIDVIKEYWERDHNRIIDARESYFKSKTDKFRDLCRINKAKVIAKRGNRITVEYGNKKRGVYNAIVPDASKGNIVTIHFDYAIEKIN